MKLTKTENTSLTIDNTHEAFKDTPYAEETFMVTFKTDTTSNLSAYTNAYMDGVKRSGDKTPDGIAMPLVAKHQLLSSIIDWAGFEDVNGNELPCTDENKSSFYEELAYNNFFNIIKKIKEDHDKSLFQETKAIKEAAKKH